MECAAGKEYVVTADIADADWESPGLMLTLTVWLVTNKGRQFLASGVTDSGPSTLKGEPLARGARPAIGVTPRHDGELEVEIELSKSSRCGCFIEA